jgi:uncharacterized protein with PIN domain
VSEEQPQEPEHKVFPKICPRCGKPMRPLSDKMLKKIYRSGLPEEALAGLSLCEECRRKATVARIREAFLGKGEGPGGGS